MNKFVLILVFCVVIVVLTLFGAGLIAHDCSVMKHLG